MLSAKQRANANLLYGLALEHGAPSPRAAEFAAAAYAESGLDENAVNAKSGAAGFYQLLSPHYRKRAEELGGLHHPVANALAILPDYLRYWKRFPNAAPGAAGRDVERSGQGAGFYAAPLQLVGPALKAGLAAAPRPAPGVTPGPAGAAAGGVDRSALASALIQSRQGLQRGQPLDVMGLVRAAQPAPMQLAGPGSAPSGLLGPMAQPQAVQGGFAPILQTKFSGSQFGSPDAEGAPARNGARYHAAADWFAPAGAPVFSPVNGRIVEVRASQGRSGQVFGGVVKVQAPNGMVFVMRHMDPARLQPGQMVRAGAPVGSVTAWTDGSPHVHHEIWRTLEGGYRYENMVDPARLYGRQAA